MSKPNTTPYEEGECIALTDYLERLKAQGHVLKFTHIPHSTWTPSKKVKGRNWAMGVRPGVPDYLIVFQYYVVFIEMKRAKGGHLSKDQKEWHDALTNVNIDVYVTKGFDEAKEIVDKYCGPIRQRIYEEKRQGENTDKT